MCWCLSIIEAQYKSIVTLVIGDVVQNASYSPFSHISMFYVLFVAVFLYFVDGASRYIRVNKTNLMHYLSSMNFVIQPLNFSGIFVAHHQEV